MKAKLRKHKDNINGINCYYLYRDDNFLEGQALTNWYDEGLILQRKKHRKGDHGILIKII